MRASATAPLRTRADTGKNRSGAGKRSGEKSGPVRRRSNNAWAEDQAGRRKLAIIFAVGFWRVRTADDTPSRNAATRSNHCNFRCQGDARPRTAAGSSRNRTKQAVAATRGYCRRETPPDTPRLSVDQPRTRLTAQRGIPANMGHCVRMLQRRPLKRPVSHIYERVPYCSGHLGRLMGLLVLG